MVKVKRALISVSDKTGIEELAKTLNEFGVEILSTGGTAKTLRDAGIPVKDVSEHTGSPEMLDGRVKTLHPKVHGGLLCRRNNPHDMEEIKKHNIDTIDMVVVNLYPFEETISKPDISFADAIENIDFSNEIDHPMRQQLEQAIKMLPPKQKSVFLLHDLQGHTHIEIAEIMKWSEGTSKSQLFKARMKIRDYLRSTIL